MYQVFINSKIKILTENIDRLYSSASLDGISDDDIALINSVRYGTTLLIGLPTWSSIAAIGLTGIVEYFGHFYKKSKSIANGLNDFISTANIQEFISKSGLNIQCSI